jgi:hypothetical protein
MQSERGKQFESRYWERVHEAAAKRIRASDGCPKCGGSGQVERRVEMELITTDCDCVRRK